MGCYTADVGLRLNACAFRVATEYLFTDCGRMELAVGLWYVVSVTGFEVLRKDPTKFEALRLTHSATLLLIPVFLFIGWQWAA